ncbi:MAG: hypothetical protein NTY07_15965 [Bacteroidia bacterium]|nr:hypothetical protein [Bacteroidia bacterium]
MKNENLFLKFASKYTDDELIKSIENPTDLEKDVYNAILTVAMNRNLISQKQFDDLFDNETILKFENIEDEELHVHTADFWKCPKCGQTVEMNFDACWNCQNDKPGEITHPTKDKIIDYQSYEKPFNIFKTGFGLIGLGIIVLNLSYSMTLPDFFGFHYLPFGKFLAGIIFVVAGSLFVLFGLFFKKSANIQCDEKTNS